MTARAVDHAGRVRQLLRRLGWTEVEPTTGAVPVPTRNPPAPSSTTVRAMALGKGPAAGMREVVVIIDAKGRIVRASAVEVRGVTTRALGVVERDGTAGSMPWRTVLLIAESTP